MDIIKKSLSDSSSRQVDPYLTITELFSDPAAKFDVVVGSLNGPHGKYINNTSDKAYFILEGQGTVYIGNSSTSVKKYDFIYIPPNTQHGVKGELKFMIITSPCFNPNNEKLGDEVK